MPSLTLALRKEYQSLFDTCQIRFDKQSMVQKVANSIVDARARYGNVGQKLKVPWYVIGVIHNMEGGLNFNTHLHNGDPLTERTKHEPAGYPKTGSPPFTWEDSAVDALTLQGYDAWTDRSIPGILFKWEAFNGWGYRKYHPEVKSPYLWSFTNHYTSGKYVEDGTWNPITVSKQVGAACLLRRLAELGELEKVEFDTMEPDLADALAGAKSGVLRYAPELVTPGGKALQAFLNSFPGIFLREDGKLGQRTSDAYRLVFGHYLAGDPRATVSPGLAATTTGATK